MGSASPVTPHSILEKFEFYFLGLTFTLLGAAIQTATFSGHSHASVFAEIIGWAGFALSGLIGLSKVEHLSEVMSIDAVISQVGENASRYGERLDKVGRRHEVKDIVQKWAFVLGLLSTAVARAYDAVAPIICG